MLVRHTATSEASSFKSLQGMLSGPEALCGVIFLRSFFTPSTAIMMLSMLGYLCPSSSGIDARSSFVKTDLNWAFNNLALVAPSECSTPWLFSGAAPGLSFLQDFINFQMGLLSLSSNTDPIMSLMCPDLARRSCWMQSHLHVPYLIGAVFSYRVAELTCSSTAFNVYLRVT